MKQFTLLLLAVLSLTVLSASKDKDKVKDDGERDFQYQELPLHRVVEGLAKLQNKNVIFSRGVENRPISLSLSSVTPTFALKLILDNYGYIAVPKGPDVLHIMTAAERGVASTSQATIIPLTNVIARDIMPNIQGYLGTGAQITINEQLNALIVSAPDETLAKVRRLVADLDQEVMQIYIEAKVIETSTKFSRDLGIEWGARGPAGIDRSQGISMSTPGANTALFGVLNAGSIQARLSVGEDKGEVKIISSPKITTLNGVPATIQSTTTYSIRTLAAVPGSSAGASPVGGLQNVRVGVNLTVTPFIVSQDQVRLNINLTKSDPDFARQVDNIPGVSDNSATTSLIVRNGQTAGIGGLIYHNEAHSRKKIPLVSDLPILGYLFGNDSRSKDNKELLIFITPTVFRGDRASVMEPKAKDNGEEWLDSAPLSLGKETVSSAKPNAEVKAEIAQAPGASGPAPTATGTPAAAVVTGTPAASATPPTATAVASAPPKEASPNNASTSGNRNVAGGETANPPSPPDR